MSWSASSSMSRQPSASKRRSRRGWMASEGMGSRRSNLMDDDKRALIQSHAHYVTENVVAALLHFHKLNSELRDHEIVVEGSDLRIHARLVDFNVHSNSLYLCQLDFLVYYGDQL